MLIDARKKLLQEGGASTDEGDVRAERAGELGDILDYTEQV